MTTLSGPKRSGHIEDSPQQWTALSGVTIWEGSVVGAYPSGANAGYLDRIEADPTLVCKGVALHTVIGGTSNQDVRVDEKIIPMAFAGGLDTSKRGALVYATDTATGTLTSGTPPIGMLMEVASATRGMVGVGPSFIARAAAALAATLTSANAFQVDEFTNPVAASTTALHAATASTVAVQTLLTAALSAPGIAALLAFPRNVTFTTAGSSATDAPDTAVITGTDIDGNALTESIAGLQGGAATYAGVKAFKTITSIVYGAGAGTGATVAVGTGVKIGFSKSIKSRAGRLAVIQQVAVATVVTTGTFVDATTSPPHGTYAPATAQDGANDYAVTYEHS